MCSVERKKMIKVVTTENFESLLALMKRYQEFYEVVEIDEKRNEEFFSKFIGGTNEGVQFLLYEDDIPVSFSTVYYSYASTISSKVAILSDLYTVPKCRGKGYGRQLIKHCVNVAKENGCARLQWFAQSDNESAKGLYQKLCTYSGDWVVYAIATKP